MNAPLVWTLPDAIELCIALEAIAPHFGAHVGLTGGLLYKDGPRKDADILIYRIRQVEYVDRDGFMNAIRAVGVEPGEDYDWCWKATWRDRPIDFFFPDNDGEYPANMLPPSHEPAKSMIDAEIAF